MSLFEFSLIPIAIIIGIAITQLLSFWARLIRHWTSVSRPGFCVSLSLWLLVVLLVHFEGLWSYREVQFGSVGELLLVMAPTLLFMLSISLLVPAGEALPGDLTADYFERTRSVFVLAALAIAVSGAPDLLPGVISPPSLLSLSAYIVPLVVLAVWNKRLLHVVGHVVLWLMLIVTHFVF